MSIVSAPLLSLDEAAKLLGGVSSRTVRRLMADRLLSACRVRRRLFVTAESVQNYVAVMSEEVHNPPRVESVAWKEFKPCHTDDLTRRSGGSNSPTQAANLLDDLLVQLTKARPRHSKQNGD